MITPILTYGSEIWIADHKINIENLHNLSFEKNTKYDYEANTWCTCNSNNSAPSIRCCYSRGLELASC